MQSDLMGVEEAARELEVGPSRVRELIAHGVLPAEKLGGRWLTRREDVLARRIDPTPAGRPLSSRNAWLALLEASDEPAPLPADPVARWRVRRSLEHQGLLVMRPRLRRRAQAHRLWALPGELRQLRAAPDVVLTGSSAAGALHLQLLAPDTIDAYVLATRLPELVQQHALQDARPTQANVVLRAIPDDVWMLAARKQAPVAAVALDLADYPDSRSARAGRHLLADLDRAWRTA